MNHFEQFKQTYITECFEQLVDMEERLLALDCDAPADMEQIGAIFRCAHSIKGGSGAFGFDFITHFTHALETVLDLMRDGKIKPARDVIDTLLKSVDIVTQMVRAANDGTRPADNLGADVLAKLQQVSGLDAAKAAPKAKQDQESAASRVFQIEFTPHPTLFLSGNEPLLILRELEKLGAVETKTTTAKVPELGALDPVTCYLGWSIRLTTTKPESAIRDVFEFVTDQCDLTIAPVPDLPSAGAQSAETKHPRSAQAAPAEEGQAPSQGQSKPVSPAASIRVDLEKVDRLVNMVGELVITEAMLRAQSRLLPGDQFPGMIRGVDELSQHTRELQEAVMSVRMQPVKSIFSRMPRIVRDLSSQLGKDIRLEMHGENTEVDKTVIEQLSDPLTHMIRNSVDHGVEKPEDRTRAGKPAEGTIRLSADHRGGRIVIEIEDDGAGINHEKVLAKAREKGVIPPDAQLTQEECYNLIFMPGFSTAAVVSNVSGRGVGMDVVKRNIEGIGGSVRITSTLGKGSCFSVSLPLTLAILDGMIVRVGSEHYIVPITAIIETLRPEPEAVHRVEGHSDVINVRGEFVRLTYLHRIFGVHGAQSDARKALVVLVETGHGKMGLVVDELIGQQQVVIKSLEANTDPVKGVSGATILGDGRVSLILDVGGLQKEYGEGAAKNGKIAA